MTKQEGVKKPTKIEKPSAEKVPVPVSPKKPVDTISKDVRDIFREARANVPARGNKRPGLPYYDSRPPSK
jgi:hypothetical protein